MRDMRPKLLDILKYEDIDLFRKFTKAPEDTTDDQILEAIHLARLEHKGINNLRKKESRGWLREHANVQH